MSETIPWLNRREETVDICALPLVQRLAALLDRDPGGYRASDALPQGWHMILFTPVTPQSGLGADGHPAASGLMSAPADLPRRMLGGRRARFEGVLRIGAEVRRVSEVVAFEAKQGRSGRLAIATIRHSIFEAGANAAAVIEEQDVIYRAAAGAAEAGAPAAEPLRPMPSLTRELTPDPVMLFRYSTITFNGHRIHYDQDYATGAEGYPGLIVNGGLTALLLLELVKELAGRSLRTMSVRNRRPLICGRPARLCVAPAGEGWDLWAEDETGRMALEAHAA
jgi:3-methylfumaryl-CoA hydratase